MVDKKTFWLGVLSIVAAVLLAAHAMQPSMMMPTARAAEAVHNEDFAMASAESPQGGEVLYVLDKRSGTLALFTWNSQARRPELVRAAPLQRVMGR